MGLPSGIVGGGYRRLLRPVLFRAHSGDPESIHETMLHTLGRIGRSPAAVSALGAAAGSVGSPITVAGISFPGRVGLAAGLDKDGLGVMTWRAMGFGFAELGTVTAQGQPGNDRPRVFRLRDSQALINRMGFNNAGARALHHQLSLYSIYRGNRAAGIPLGISLGKTKTTPLDDAVGDYLDSFDLVAPHADYIAVNVSSPNTPGLRALQDGGALRTLLSALTARSEERNPGDAVPIFVKVAPDLTWGALDDVLEAGLAAGIAGVIATNTTLARDGLAAADERLAVEAGGLSGAPLTARAREVVGYVTGHTPLPVIGVGGIMTTADAAALFDLGASLVQLYTGFIYSGPALAAGINAWTRRDPS